MAKITKAGDADRQFLASLPELKEGGAKPISQLDDAYAHRMAQRGRKLMAAGVTPSRQALRGHVETPEHPGGARPKLPEKPSSYYLRPLVHPTPLVSAGGYDIFREVPGDEAMQIIRYLSRDTTHGTWTDDTTGLPMLKGTPLVMLVRDERTNAVYEAFGNWHGVRVGGQYTGIHAGLVLKMLRDSGLSLEEFVLNALADGKSSPHIHISALSGFQITALSAA